MKYLPIFNKGDKVTVNNKYIGLKSMVGEIYTIRAGPARCSDTWCYWLENVAGGIAADALEPLEQTNEEMLRGCTFEELAGAIYEWYSQGHIEGKVGKQLSSVTRVVEWLKEKHDALPADESSDIKEG